MKKQLGFLCLTGLLYVGLATASPWSCLNNWTIEHQSVLDSDEVKFWHGNGFLTEAYSFTAEDPRKHPFCNDNSSSCSENGRSPLGKMIVAAAVNCGATTHFYSIFD